MSETVNSGTVTPLIYVGDLPLETDCPLLRAYIAIRLAFEVRPEEFTVEKNEENEKK